MVLGNGLKEIGAYIARSAKYLKQGTRNAFEAEHLVPSRHEMALFSFKKSDDIEKFVVGADADMGGPSEGYFALTNRNTALFYGTLSTNVPPGIKIERSGYAAIRSRQDPLTLFHKPVLDLSAYRYLAIKCRVPSPSMISPVPASELKKQYFVNIQTESPFPSYLYQHRLNLLEPISDWQTLLLPFRSFTLTAMGYVQKNQLAMDTRKIRTIGISLVRQDGPFELEIESIKALNKGTLTPELLDNMNLDLTENVDMGYGERGLDAAAEKDAYKRYLEIENEFKERLKQSSKLRLFPEKEKKKVGK